MQRRKRLGLKMPRGVEFKATIHMEMSAFEKLAKKKFKGVYWLSETPVQVEA